jgi:PAS domain S-box-containing protein
VEDQAEEIRRLQGCINNLVSVLALPALWSDHESSQIVRTLLDVLLGMLRLDFAYARLNETVDGSPVEMVRLAQHYTLTAQPQKVGRVIAGWLIGDPSPSPFVAPNPVGEGEVSVASFRLGVQDEVGIFVAGSQRADFPTEIEMLLLRVAANQTAMGLQEARRLSEQRRAAKEGIIERQRIEEERWTLAALVENSTHFIGIASLDGQVLFVNPAGQHLVGLAGNAHAQATRIFDYIVESERERFQQHILPTALREGRWEGETQFRHLQTGTAIPMLHHLFFIKEQNSDRPVALATISRDITEPKRVEQALARSEAHLALGERLSHTGSWTWNVSTGEIFGSQEYFRILGFDPPETSSAQLDVLVERIHPEDRSRFDQVYKQVRLEREDSEVEYRIVLPDGAMKHLHVVTRPIVDKSGNVTEFHGVIRDVTERRQAEDALRRAQAELAHAARVMTMGELTASIAHEINQPLAAVVTNAHACSRLLIGASPDLDEARAAAADIAEAGTRASAVITRIRALLQKAVPAETRLDLNTVIQEVIGLTHSELNAHQVSVRTELLAELPPVLGDRVQVQQVLLNLIMNGIEAMTAVTNWPRMLFLRSQIHESDSILIAVQDSGVGLDPQDMDRIFDTFFTTKSGGMGMGLAISRSIVETHGGRLWAAANSGPGATFQFTLPVCREDAP